MGRRRERKTGSEESFLFSCLPLIGCSGEPCISTGRQGGLSRERQKGAERPARGAAVIISLTGTEGQGDLQEAKESARPDT